MGGPDMDKKFGYYVFGGLLVGALFGLLVGSANQNPLMGAAIGALVGVAIGWFAAAAFLLNKTGKG
jgi:uncharacterized membrane protein